MFLSQTFKIVDKTCEILDLFQMVSPNNLLQKMKHYLYRRSIIESEINLIKKRPHCLLSHNIVYRHMHRI